MEGGTNKVNPTLRKLWVACIKKTEFVGKAPKNAAETMPGMFLNSTMHIYIINIYINIGIAVVSCIGKLEPAIRAAH
jgi:pyruvate/2-oxoglutarate dehydrogenase complex dihydrolipoamide acyltransferase (E2) component